MGVKIEQLISYLPYELMLQQEHIDGVRSHLMTGISIKYDRVDIEDGNYYWSYIKGIKPIFRPLSDLFDETPLNVINILEGIVIDCPLYCDAYIEWYNSFMDNPEPSRILQAPYEVIQELLKQHFDIFDLIKDGYAIDMNII